MTTDIAKLLRIPDLKTAVLKSGLIMGAGLAQVLIDRQYKDDDQLLALFESIDPEIKINVPIPCYTAYLAIGCLQLILRSSERRMLDDVRHYIRALSEGIVQIAPEVNWLLERGWHPA